MRTALKQEGYRTLEAPGVPEAHALLAHELDLALIVADARLGAPLWEMSETLRADMPAIPLIILSSHAQDEETGFEHGARAFIQQPFQNQQFLACVTQFARREE